MKNKFNFLMERKMQPIYKVRSTRTEWKSGNIYVLAIIVVGIILLSVRHILICYRNISTIAKNEIDTMEVCHESESCNLQIVESIPIGMNYTNSNEKFMSTFEAWQTLLDISTSTVNIGSFYWTLRGADVVNHSSANQGEKIFDRLISNGITRKLKIRITQSEPNESTPDWDTQLLEKHGAAEVRSVDFGRLLGSGVLHTKLWVVDEKHFYLGSANMDWRSLTQVKELGVLGQNCSCMARDVAKIFEEYWYLGLNVSTVPIKWPKQFSTNFNWSNPLTVDFNKKFTMSAFFSNSPAPLSASGRTNDIDAILNTIRSAKSFINIAVMDYFPLLIYTPKIRYWPIIDDALKTSAIENKVSIKMLISLWSHSNPSEDNFLTSLSSLSSSFKGTNIEIRRFIVPSNADQNNIPYSRVNHNKYMVTDNTAYIGTSNWSGDYFTDTAGAALILRDMNADVKNLRTNLLSIFQRDWESPYAYNITYGLKAQ